MNHYMNLKKRPYLSIKSGQKTIELRLCDEKRKNITEGDVIVFDCEGEDSLYCRVRKVHKFPSFKELYATLPLEKCGYTKEELATASYKDMEEYYPLEKQLAHSVLGIEIEVIHTPHENT